MIELPEGNPWKKAGVWRRVKRPDGTFTARVSCPGCGESASLDEHEIATRGTVSPSLDCPNDDCTFHDHVRLFGWDADPAPPS